MARYLGPKAKLARRENTRFILEKCVNALDSKCKLDVKPGQHGARQACVRLTSVSNCVKSNSNACNGVLERQFRRYFAADRLRGNTGENLVRLLEPTYGQRGVSHGFRLNAR